MDARNAALQSAWPPVSHNNVPPPKSVPMKRKRSGGELSVSQDETDGGRHICDICQRSFGRIEHLKRHAGSHNGERPFKCSVCDKGFYRVDTMQRHELTHRENESSKPKGARACGECAVAKVRCSGSQPCARCENRGNECRYPENNPLSDDTRSSSGAVNPPAHSIGDLESRHGGVVQEQRAPSLPSIKSNPAGSIPFATDFWGQSTTQSPRWMRGAFSPHSFQVSPQDPEAATPLEENTASAQIMQSPLFPSTLGAPFRVDQAGSNSAPANDPTPPTSSTRHWLATVIEPQATDVDVETPSTVSQGASNVGHFYVDGDGARLPVTGPQRRFTTRHSSQLPAWLPFEVLGLRGYGFPASDHFAYSTQDANKHKTPFLDRNTYAKLGDHFDEICTVASPFYPKFESNNFPSHDMLDWFIGLYLEVFQPLIPMLHLPTLDLSSSHWLLSLGLASVGSHFAEMEGAERYTLALHEFLRRALHVLIHGRNEMIDPVVLSQVKLMGCIGWLYCGDENLEKGGEKDGWRYHSDVCTWVTTDWAHMEAGFQLSKDTSRDATIRDWNRWKNMETCRRTGYSIWLLDCMWSYQFQRRPQLALEDAAKVPLPCQEVLWEAESAMQWRQVLEYSVRKCINHLPVLYTPNKPTASPTLVAATQSIYVDRKVESTMGEYSRILLIHALYRRNWEVEDYLRQPLSYWRPTADKQDVETFVREPIWLPETTTYSRWRNANCDSLDILHWRANSVVGAASGIEHPTILHLHLARVVLLTPFRDIYNLACGITKEQPNMSQAQALEHSNAVRRWAQEDQCKARLAIYHAGVLFWHVRRYSASGFYEPSAVLLAALALWAYGTYTDMGPSPPSAVAPTTLPSPNDDELAYPTSINLDRPADDEIVQTYIRRGDRMQALITGVGDIRSPHGPERVLLIGSKLVSALQNWGYSQKALRVLTTLAQHCRQQQRAEQEVRPAATVTSNARG